MTKPLEASIAGIDAVDVITSIGRPEQAQISVRFRLEKDADTAAAEVRDRSSRVRNKLRLRPENGFRLVPVYSYGYRLEKLGA